MRIVSGRDVVYGLITGLTTGIIADAILRYLGKSLPLGINTSVLIWLVPILWILGVQLGYILGVWFKPFVQFGRFAAIGFANALVDFGVLYLLIALTGLSTGIAYALFKTLSFSVATVHSYFWNKIWAFQDSARGGSGEIGRFLVVALASVLVNVAAASITIALRPAGFTTAAWAGVGAVVGSAVALIFSFTGFRVFVFRKK
ncbi:MAG TPA: GtrA family protein [Candidatus Paceibacterota bacterium]|nr:GtrA family protein [Candidatus Paceibacterota bacterium]